MTTRYYPCVVCRRPTTFMVYKGDDDTIGKHTTCVRCYELGSRIEQSPVLAAKFLAAVQEGKDYRTVRLTEEQS